MEWNLNIGDIVVQLIVLAIPVLVVALLVLAGQSSRRKKEQLDRIEAKLDALLEKK
ncbi:MAG: hypothetical protein ACI35O_10395 [Bacillaceae bacterium]